MPFLAPLVLTGIVIIFTVFMLVKREDLRNRLLRLVGLGQINIMTQALDDAAQRVSRYLLMQFLVNAGFGALFGTGLYFIGVPNAALWGVLAALLRIVLYVGTMVAAALPIILSLAVFDGWLPPLVFALFAGLELIIGNFVEPWLYGAHTGISSLALLVTAVFWTVLWGPAGLILSTPLTVCVVVLGRYFPQLSFLHILLGRGRSRSRSAALPTVTGKGPNRGPSHCRCDSKREIFNRVIRFGVDTCFEPGGTGPAQWDGRRNSRGVPFPKHQ
jgi:predicted PurR-regulated permease PerM